MITISHLGALVFAYGLWGIIDGAMSILLYLSANSYRPDEKQTWLKDHPIRCIRIIGGIIVAIIGWMLI